MEAQIFDGAPPVLPEDPERVVYYRTARAVNGITPFSQGGEPPPPRARTTWPQCVIILPKLFQELVEARQVLETV